MTVNECSKEASVLAALANDSITDELTAHLHSCPVCQDAKLVWGYLRDAAATEAETDIAPAGAIWWRAQLAKKRAAAHRSIALIDTMQKIALAVAAIAVIAMGAWQAPKLFEIPPVLLAGSAGVVVLLLASVAVVLSLERDSGRSTVPRGM